MTLTTDEIISYVACASCFVFKSTASDANSKPVLGYAIGQPVVAGAPDSRLVGGSRANNRVRLARHCLMQ